MCNLHIYLRSKKNMVKDPPIQHERTAEVYSAYSSSRECQIRSRRDQTLLTKLHTGKFKGLRAYKIFLDRSDLTCPSAIRSRKIFNTGCTDTERQRNWNLIFSVRTQEVGQPDKAPCTGSGLGEEKNSPRGHIKTFINSGKLAIYLTVSFFIYLFRS